MSSVLYGVIMLSILKEEGKPLDLPRTYRALIEGSLESRQYLRLYVHGHDGAIDVIGNGRFACAFYTSSILTLTTLISQVHTTVFETIEDMVRSHWFQVDSLEPGAVIVWGPKMCSDGNHHKHIGFYLGDDTAISTDGVTGIPTKHHVTYGTVGGTPVRPIECIYFHKKLQT